VPLEEPRRSWWAAEGRASCFVVRCVASCVFSDIVVPVEVLVHCVAWCGVCVAHRVAFDLWCLVLWTSPLRYRMHVLIFPMESLSNAVIQSPTFAVVLPLPDVARHEASPSMVATHSTSSMTTSKSSTGTSSTICTDNARPINVGMRARTTPDRTSAATPASQVS